jgi:hypothetical protein
MPLITRRSIIAGLAASLAAPAIVRSTSLMPVGSFKPARLFTGVAGYWQGVPILLSDGVDGLLVLRGDEDALRTISVWRGHSR